MSKDHIQPDAGAEREPVGQPIEFASTFYPALSIRCGQVRMIGCPPKALLRPSQATRPPFISLRTGSKIAAFFTAALLGVCGFSMNVQPQGTGNAMVVEPSLFEPTLRGLGRKLDQFLRA